MEYALITGASRGIGRAIAQRLAQDGFPVLVNYRRNDQEAAVTLRSIEEAGGHGELLRFDISNAEEVANALEVWKQGHPDDTISVLVNNAGVRKDELMVFMEQSSFENVLQTNLFSFFYVTRALLPDMIVQPETIINTEQLPTWLTFLPVQYLRQFPQHAKLQ